MAAENVGLIETALAILPEVDKPVAEMTLGELLVTANRASLVASLDMCRRYDPEMDIKERRLIVELNGQLTRANLQVADGQFKAQKLDVLERLALAIEADAAGGKG